MSNLIRWKSQKDTKTRGKVELHYVSAQTYKKTKKDNTNNNTFYETLALSLIHYAPGTHSLMFCAAYHRPQQLPRKIHPLCDPHLSHPRTPITVMMLPIRKRIPENEYQTQQLPHIINCTVNKTMGAKQLLYAAPHKIRTYRHQQFSQ